MRLRRQAEAKESCSLWSMHIPAASRWRAARCAASAARAPPVKGAGVTVADVGTWARWLALKV